jgi:hypothetical protein
MESTVDGVRLLKNLARRETADTNLPTYSYKQGGEGRPCRDLSERLAQY